MSQRKRHFTIYKPTLLKSTEQRQCTSKHRIHTSQYQCQECARPGRRYLIDGQYLYFCEFHIGYYAFAFQQYAMPIQPQGGGEA
jgi:hypothetical protein